MSTCKRIKSDPYHTPFTKNLKWITDLNVKTKTIIDFEENRRVSLCDPGFGKDFLDSAPKVLAVQEKTGKLNFMKTKHFSI